LGLCTIWPLLFTACGYTASNAEMVQHVRPRTPLASLIASRCDAP
jgi:hypothetical protein